MVFFSSELKCNVMKIMIGHAEYIFKNVTISKVDCLYYISKITLQLLLFLVVYKIKTN